jgi:hypothetical protein
MRSLIASSLFVTGLFADKPCTLPEGTEGADDGNPHCWDRIRRCDGPNAHPDDGPGYTPACGACEGLGGPAWGDENEKIELPKCTPLPMPGKNDTQPVPPAWALMGDNGKFTIENDRFLMIGKKTDPFCFSFFPSNNSVGNQCYRKQTGKFQVDMSKGKKSVRYDLNLHIPWPSDRFSLFGNISTTIFHHGPNMWVLNNLYNLMQQCVCIQPLSGGSGPHGSHDPTPIYPVMYNWTNHLTYLARERLEIEYEIGEMDVDHWVFGPHHAWTPVGSNEIVRMWQPYNGFEVFQPGAFKPGYVDEKDFENMVPPPQCKKGGALARITCTDDGFPTNKTEREPVLAEPSDLRRARTKVPREQHKGSSFRHMAARLNGFVAQYGNVKECHKWTTLELQRFQALMLMLRSSELNKVYAASDDKRVLRGDEQEHGARWEHLTALASTLGAETVQRDGHCHEAVMWFVHHVPESIRNAVAEVMALPLLPYTQHQCNDKHEVCDEYLKQVSCQDCHKDADAPITI